MYIAKPFFTEWLFLFGQALPLAFKQQRPFKAEGYKLYRHRNDEGIYHGMLVFLFLHFGVLHHFI
jgi:hypothetical protein